MTCNANSSRQCVPRGAPDGVVAGEATLHWGGNMGEGGQKQSRRTLDITYDLTVQPAGQRDKDQGDVP